MWFIFRAAIAVVVLWISYKWLTATYKPTSEQTAILTSETEQEVRPHWQTLNSVKEILEEVDSGIDAEVSASTAFLKSTRAAHLETIHRNNSHVYKLSTSRPLSSQEIRVLEFEYNYFELNQLECTLKRVPLNSYYHALSYTWGDECNTVAINVDGLRFEITRNLLAALQRISLLRSPEKTVLWIDAICINQGDISEKSSHLRRMREIYAGAYSTFAWLGEGSDRSDHAMTYFGRFSDGVDMDKVLKEDKYDKPMLHGLKVDQLLREYEENRSAWYGLGDLTIRQYFRRLWIVQEVIVSGTVIAICGTSCLPFYILTSMLALANDHGLEIAPLEEGTLSLRSTYYQATITHLHLFRTRHREGDLPLRQWVSMYAFRQECADDRDRVWALLGLASDRYAPELAGIRYEDSVNDTYEAIASHIIKSGDDLDYICLGHGLDRSTELGLPSWVPDLRSRYNLSGTVMSRNFLMDIQGEFAAAGRDFSPYSPRFPPIRRRDWEDTAGAPNFSSDGKVLIVPGVLVDSVREVGKTFSLTLNTGSALRSHNRANLLESVQLARTCAGGGDLATKPYGRGKASYLEAFARTLACDRDSRGRRRQDGEGFFPYKMLSRSMVPEEEFIMATSPVLEQFNEHIHRHQKRFMISEGGLMGLVPKRAEVGDSICVLFGCTVPVILRPIAGRMGYYTFVGER